MSGPENLKGIDYQISFTLLTIIEFLKEDFKQIKELIFESLNEDEEDFNIIKKDGSKLFFQIKKKTEGYNWTPSELKHILTKFYLKNDGNTKFFFISNGGGNTKVKELKDKLNKNIILSDKFLIDFSTENMDIKQLKSFIKNLSIRTLSYTTDEINDPAKLIREKIINLICKPPFLLNEGVNKIYDSLWKYIFDLSKNAEYKNIDDLLIEFNDLGLIIIPKEWERLPNIDAFKGRKLVIQELLNCILIIKRVIIQGINGIGKTWLLSKTFNELTSSDNNVFWLNLTNIHSSAFFISLFTNFLNNIGLENESLEINNAGQINEQVRKIANSITRNKIILLIDDFNNASPDLYKSIKQLFSELLKKEIKGSIIISTTIIPSNFYTKFELSTNKIKEFYLHGFNFDEIKLIVKEIGDFSLDDIQYIYESTKGHPISILFLKNLLIDDHLANKDLEELKKQSIEYARDWIIKKSINLLSDNEKETITTLSIFENDFSEFEAEQIIKSTLKPKYLFEELIKKGFITFNDGSYSIHASIKEIAKDMLSNSKKLESYNSLFSFHNNNRDQFFPIDSELSFERFMEWGKYLERVKNLSPIEDTLEKIFALDNFLIDGLWAIERYGYPFEYVDFGFPFEMDNSFKFESENIINKLKILELIEENKDCKNVSRGDPKIVKEWKIKNPTQTVIMLITYLCHEREISHLMGYIKIFKPNLNFLRQGLICPWEHCIEYMPLNPEDEKDYISDMIEKLNLNTIPKETIEKVLKIINSNVSNLNKVENLKPFSCKIFGHCCPGGKEQVKLCFG
jgi:hypothetical protein